MPRSAEPLVLVAPDKFKGSATATAVADAVADGLGRTLPTGWVVRRRPVADGGDGTVDVLLAAGWAPGEVDAADARGRPCRAPVAVDGGRAVVELASFAGLARLGPQGADPWTTGSAGLALVLRGLGAAGVRDVVVGLGGSASTDGGLGLLLGLGARAVDARGRTVTPDARGLMEVAAVDLGPVTLPPGMRIALACDVRAPMVGPGGAVATFGPQKGLPAQDVPAVDRAMSAWGALLERASGRPVREVPGSGAAGGIGAAGVALGWPVVGGAAFVLDAVRFDDDVARAALVVTGEGSWDGQSLVGKAPALVAERARGAGLPVVLVAGRVDPSLTVGFEAVHSLVEVAGSERDAMARTTELLARIGAEIGRAAARVPDVRQAGRPPWAPGLT